MHSREEADSLGCHHMKIRVERSSATFSVFRRSVESNGCRVCDVAPVPQTLDILKFVVGDSHWKSSGNSCFRADRCMINLLFFFLCKADSGLSRIADKPFRKFLRYAVGARAASCRATPLLATLVKEINPCTDLDRPLGVQEVEARKISRHSAHDSGKAVGSTHRLSLPSRRFSWYQFLLEAE